MKLEGRLREVAELLSKGLTFQQVADSLHLSRHTIHDYATRIYSKLGIHSRLELAVLWHTGKIS